MFFFREFEVNGASFDKGSPGRSSGRISPNKSNGSRSRSRSPHKGSVIISPDGSRMIFQSPSNRDESPRLKGEHANQMHYDKVTRII